MTPIIQCTFADVTEHDMDLLFLEEFVCSDEFLKLFRLDCIIAQKPPCINNEGLNRKSV